ncbi:MAG: hypothetical protein ABMB14_09515 [Myxococcota bacterium]
MIPGLGELPLPDSFPCPVCPADIGEVCEPDCHAGSARVLVFYLPYDEGKRLLENLRRYHLARAIEQVEAPPVPTAAEQPPASDAVAARKR